MFGAIARWVIAHPWQTIAGWLIVAVAVILFSPSLETYTTANQQTFLPSTFQSSQAQAVGAKYFPTQSGATGSLVITRHDHGQLTPADQKMVADLATSLMGDHIAGLKVAQVTPNSLSTNSKAMLVQVAFNGQPGDEVVNDAVNSVRSKSTSFLAGSGLDNGLTGNASIQVDTTNAYGNAETIITIATVVAIMALLGIIFRSVVIAVLPIIVIGIVHQVTAGVTAWLAELFKFQVGSVLAPLLVVVLFGIGTDYIVFILFRYRARLRTGEPHTDALEFACSVVGKVVASSALTVMGAFGALFVAKLGSLQTLAPGLLVAVAAMLITALTLIPALFTVIGEALFWPSGHGSMPKHNRFGTEGAFVARAAGVVAAAVLVVIIGLTIASFGYKATYNTLAELPSSTKSQVAYNTLSDNYPPGQLGPTQIYVSGGGRLTPQSLSGLVKAVSPIGGVAAVAQPQFSTDQTAALVNVILKDNPYDVTAIDLVDNQVRPAVRGTVPGDSVFVGGQTSTLVDVRKQLNDDTRHVFPVAAVLILIILGLLLRAILAPVNLLVCVFLAFSATLGAATLLFLHALNFSGIDYSLPIVLYLFVVAIGTDYNILLASRLREEYVNGYSSAEAAGIAVGDDGPTVAAAGLILALTFASLMLTGIQNLIELGFGVAVGVCIAAFGMAPLLVPSLSALEGRAFWWPTRSHPRGTGSFDEVVDAPVATGID